jgi:hypothetical protein
VQLLLRKAVLGCSGWREQLRDPEVVGVWHLACSTPSLVLRMIEPLVTSGLPPGQEALDALEGIIDSNDLAALWARHGLNQGEVLAMVKERARQKGVLLREALAELVAEL